MQLGAPAHGGCLSTCSAYTAPVVVRCRVGLLLNAVATLCRTYSVSAAAPSTIASARSLLPAYPRLQPQRTLASTSVAAAPRASGSSSGHHQGALARIRAATTPLEIQNALRRPLELTPRLAVAKLLRLSELITPEKRSSLQASDKAVVAKLLLQVEQALDTFLHLLPADQLAELLLAQGRSGGYGTQHGLVPRAAAILLANGGRELQAAGPQALVKAAEGLKLMGLQDAEQCGQLAGLLKAVPEASELAGWFERRQQQAATS